MGKFEKVTTFYLESSGWTYVDDYAVWAHPWFMSVLFSTAEALYKQLSIDYERDGNVERAAELFDRGDQGGGRS